MCCFALIAILLSLLHLLVKSTLEHQWNSGSPSLSKWLMWQHELETAAPKSPQVESNIGLSISLGKMISMALEAYTSHSLMPQFNNMGEVTRGHQAGSVQREDFSGLPRFPVGPGRHAQVVATAFTGPK